MPPSSRAKRVPRGHEPVHPLEIVLLVLTGAELGFLPWAFGGVDAPGEIAGAAVAVAALAVALVPRRSAARPVDEYSSGLSPFGRLLRFPVFWAGLAGLAYVGVQALNPAFEYHLDETTWWLSPIDHVRWLPAGMRAPFAEMNPWRAMIVGGSAWATGCALWIGITHRRTILWLLTALAINAAELTAFGIVQRAGGAPGPYGVRPAESPFFFASFVYKNHAAAYLGLLGSVALGLAGDAFRTSRRRHERSSPAILFFFFALLAGVGIVLSFSLSGIVLFGAVVLTAAAAAAWQSWRSAARTPVRLSVIVTASVLLLLAAGLAVVVGSADLRSGVERVVEGKTVASARTRWLAARRGAEMLADRWVAGWGAGCFRYGFTKYQHRDAELTQWRQAWLRWEHVHDDWLEFLIELGVTGFLPILATAAFWLRRIVRLRLWREPLLLPILCGLAALALHACWDFPLQCPAILGTASALLPLAVRWGEIGDRTRPV